MKVLHVIPSISPAHGGPSHALTTMERELSSRGVRVETCTTDDDGPGHRNGKPTGIALVENGVTRRYFRKQSEFYKFSGGLAWWIWRHAGDYDLIHIHALFSFTSVAAAWAARRAKVPYVIRPLGTLNRFGIEQRRPWLKRLSLRLIERPLLARAAAVHFTSTQEEAEARGLGSAFRGAVVPLGVEPSVPTRSQALLARHPTLQGATCLLFLSRVDPKKNLEGLLQAVALCQDIPGLVLLVAGDGDAAYVDRLKQLANDLGLERRVVWAGRLDGMDKAGAFAAAEVFVLPSFSENFGIAAAEALAAGLPCILGKGVALANDVAAAGAGLAIDPTAIAIADAIQQIMRSEELRGSMKNAASALASDRLSAQAMGSGLVALYSGILAGK